MRTEADRLGRGHPMEKVLAKVATARVICTLFIMPWVILANSEGHTGHFNRVCFSLPLMRPLGPPLLVRGAVMMDIGFMMMTRSPRLWRSVIMSRSVAMDLAPTAVTKRGLWPRRWLPQPIPVTLLCGAALARLLVSAALHRRAALRRGPRRRRRQLALAAKACVTAMRGRGTPAQLVLRNLVEALTRPPIPIVLRRRCGHR